MTTCNISVKENKNEFHKREENITFPSQADCVLVFIKIFYKPFGRVVKGTLISTPSMAAVSMTIIPMTFVSMTTVEGVTYSSGNTVGFNMMCVCVFNYFKNFYLNMICL